LLKAEHLDLLRDFPRELVALEYASFGDGVLFGCRVNAAGGELAVAPGAVLRAGVLYRLTGAFQIPYAPSDAFQYINLRFSDESQSADIVSHCAEIVLDSAPADENRMELGRFKLKEGARLRSDYVDFEDISTEYDTLNTVHVPCACRGGQTLLPFITEYFAKEALSYRPENPIDLQFAFLCLQTDRVNLPVLQGYLRSDDTDLRELYHALSRKLSDIRSGRSTTVQKERSARAEFHLW
jgi:hypothetical protein